MAWLATFHPATKGFPGYVDALGLLTKGDAALLMQLSDRKSEVDWRV
jgi:hypothetical protein